MWKVISCTEFLWVVGRGLPDDRTRLKGYIFVFLCVCSLLQVKWLNFNRPTAFEPRTVVPQPVDLLLGTWALVQIILVYFYFNPGCSRAHLVGVSWVFYWVFGICVWHFTTHSVINLNFLGCLILTP